MTHRFIFVLRRRSGNYLLLHPFRPADALFRNAERLVLEGRYASEPAIGEPDAIRLALHAELEKAARRDALEHGFYIRLTASAAVFLVLYLFLSIVVRDPIPVVDELLAGGLGAFACWFTLERRTLSSAAFADRAAALRGALDSALFRPSRMVRYLEEALQDAEILAPERYAGYSPALEGSAPSDEELRELDAMAVALESRLPSEAAEEARAASGDSSGMLRLIRRQGGRKRLDLPVLLSYVRLRALIGARE